MPRNVFLSMTLAARRLDWITVFGVLVFVASVVGAVFTAMDLLGINF
jgi:hypothetical protein